MRGDLGVLDKLRTISRADVAIPQPVLAEISYGINRLPNSKRRELLREKFDVLRLEFPRAHWSDEVSESYGSIKAALEKKGGRIEDFDAAIAAHALAYGAVLVSANRDHMNRVPGILIEDWSSKR